MLVISRFRVSPVEAGELRAGLEAAVAVLSEQQGCLEASVGRNVDEPELWVLQTRWTGPGAYRRALSAYDVKVRAWAVLSRAIDEPSAYEVLTSGQSLNRPQPRDLP